MKQGFTLIELLIVIAITVILATVSILSLSGFRQNQALRLTSQALITFLRDAQSKSISQEGGSQWGVQLYTQPGGRSAYYLFNNPSIPLNVVALPASVEFDPAMGALPKDVTFSKITGWPNPPITITIRLVGQPDISITINVNAQGTITEN